MIRLGLISIILYSTAGFAAAAPTYINLKVAMQNFYREAQGKDLTTQIQIWQKDIEAQIPDVYVHIWSDMNSASPGQARTESATKWFPFLFAHSDAILAQFDLFDHDGWSITQKLVSRFPQVDFSDVRVIAMPTLMSFNGQVMTVQGRPVVGFGMDMLELIAETPKLIPGADLVNDTSVMVAHEFTHALHPKLSDFGTPGNISDYLVESVWEEGLAEVHSQMLVPGADMVHIFSERNLATRCTSQQLFSWAPQLLIDAQATDETQIVANYTKWFLMRGWKTFGVGRAGYCLGYYVILSSLRNHSINEILAMKRVNALQETRAALQEFSQDNLTDSLTSLSSNSKTNLFLSHEEN
jgi:hypothetical protein